MASLFGPLRGLGRRCGALLASAAAAVLSVSPGAANAQNRPPLPPTARLLAAAGPDSFDVAFSTTKGRFVVRFRRPWAPRGADRVFRLVQAGYYDGVRFYRVLPGFAAQFGFHGDPAVTRAWDAHPMPDDPVRVSNTAGTVTFATRGPGTRTVQLFVNLADNRNLDALGFAPVGTVVEGLDVARSLYGGYGEGAPRGSGPDQDLIATRGNAYLSARYPRLDAIDSARVAGRWPPT